MVRITPLRRRYKALIVAFALLIAIVLYVVNGARERVLPESQPPHHTVVPTTITPYLPFDMPTGSSSRKVFAHYVPWFVISVDNLPADQDYYTTQLMNPNGENGVHRAYGGLMRDRPMPRPPIKDPLWRDIDVATDISQAKSVGIDGFAVDVVDPSAQDDGINRVLEQARAIGGFAIQITADMSGAAGTLNEADFARSFAPFLKAAAAQRLSDGRVVFGAFFAEHKPTSWWATALDLLRTAYGVNVAFVPTFLDAASNLDAFASVSYGLSSWGTRYPAGVNPTNTEAGSAVDVIRRAHRLGRLWMQPVAYQDNRPKQGRFEESENGVTSRSAWRIAVDENAEWVNLITWNDYAETTAFAPSAKHGWRLLDMAAWEIAVYKYGSPPEVRRETLYVSHRTQPFAARPSFPETQLMHNTGLTPPRDTIEVESFAFAPATVVARVGDTWHLCDVPAGVGVCTFPLAPGRISVMLSRDNVATVTVTSPFEVTDTPFVQDLQYVAGGGLR
ncbi:MAG: hypothetical protein QOH57_316 [Mycobacterium sp.]|nr:hypothetical protein [Mycobacterium sp.]